jgi:hypothetical protein
MDIVYPLGKGSLYNNFELRMSLRSLEKHLANMGEVWIIGEKPEWLQNVHHIHKHDINTVPDRNMMEKLKVACETPEISEEFLMVHDDHYLLADFDANTFPYFYSEDLKEYVAKRFDQGYGQRAKNSLQHLTEKGLPTLHYDIHYPIRYNKQKFLEVIPTLPWATTRQGFIIKSVYSNSTGVIPTLEKDYKINSHPLHSNVKVMSSFPHMRAAVTRFLMETFPTKSRYESSGI